MSFASWGNNLYSGKTSYNIIGRRKMFLSLGLAVIVISALLIGTLGLQRSIDFKGGTEITVSAVSGADQGPAMKVISSDSALKDASASSLGTSSVRIQSKTLSTNQAVKVKDELAKAYNVSTDQVAITTIGPSWGSDVTHKAIQSLVIFFVLVGLMLAFYFRTWTMSASALFALVHDVLVTAAVLAITRVEISPATIIGVLTILGYSLYDTVVVFDKVRELTHNYQTQSKYTYAELVNLSVNQTLVRSINTSVVALLPVGSILVISWVLLGGGTLRDISLALFVGMIAGTFSSIFIAPTLLVWLRSRGRKVSSHTAKVAAKRSGKEVKVETNDKGVEELVVAHPVRAGVHLGQAAQPKKAPRSRR